MSEFDGRTMRYIDTFGQRFTEAGTYRYRLGVSPYLRLPDGDDDEFEVVVARGEGKAGSAQHHLSVSWSNAGFRPDRSRVEIRSGETVTWAAADAAVPVFEVAGSGPGGPFSSALLQHEALVAHVFMSPGRYRWADARDPDVGGTVKVRQVLTNTKTEFDAWVKSVSSGTLIRIVGDKADKSQVEIPVGHTVCWTVEKSKGLALRVDAVADEATETPRRPASPTRAKVSAGRSGGRGQKTSRR
jgi:plastocyanin